MKPIKPRIPTIAITGSAGKSTTAAFIHAILKTKWKVLKTKKNNNLPRHTKQNLKRLKSSHQAMVLEMGLGREAGKKHFKHIQPDYGIITNIGTAHYGKLGNSVKAIARSKSILAKKMYAKGTLFVNNDDKNSKLLQTKNFKGTLLTVGIKNKADYQAQNLKYVDKGMTFKVKLRGETHSFYIPTFGEHNVINALFAIGVADRLGFSPAKIRSGLKKYDIPPRRQNVIQLPHRSMLIDDTFNANPQSVKAALKVMKKIGQNKKKIVVLGSMLELGKHSVKGHEEIGRYVAKQNVDAILTYGKKAKQIRKAALKNGFPTKNIQYFTNRTQLHNALKKKVKANTVFLVKGSHKMRMDKTAEYIAQHSVQRAKKKSKKN